MTLNRGQWVRVKVYPQGQRRLRVWLDVDPGVLLTTGEEFERAQTEQREPITVGFPKWDVSDDYEPIGEYSP